MADQEKRAWNIILILGLAGVVFGLGWLLVYAFGPRGELDDDRQTEQEEIADRQEHLAAVDTMGHELELLYYNLDQEARQIEGEVENQATHPYVNVHIAFEVLNADQELISTVNDTLGHFAAQDRWQFQLPIPGNEEIAHVEHVSLRGTQRAPVPEGGDPGDGAADPGGGMERQPQ